MWLYFGTSFNPPLVVIYVNFNVTNLLRCGIILYCFVLLWKPPSCDSFISLCYPCDNLLSIFNLFLIEWPFCQWKIKHIYVSLWKFYEVYFYFQSNLSRIEFDLERKNLKDTSNKQAKTDSELIVHRNSTKPMQQQRENPGMESLKQG